MAEVGVEVKNPPVVENEATKLFGCINTVQDFYKSEGVTTVLVGSMGRAASIGTSDISLVNPFSGRIRDIDLMCLNNPNLSRKIEILEEAKKKAFPFKLDECFGGRVRLGEHSATIRYKDIELPISSEVFGVRNFSFHGYTIDTLDPNTLFHLTALYGPMRPKDFNQLMEFGRQLRDDPNLLPEELLRPFHDLAREIEKQYPGEVSITRLRWLYHKYVGYETRRRLSRIIKPARKLFVPICSWVAPVNPDDKNEK